MSATEPRNPLYLLLLLAGLVFVLTALAYALVPVLEQKAIDAGNPPPPSEWRDALRAEGWIWLLVELGVLVVLGIASMVWDARRSLQNDSRLPTIASQDPAVGPIRARGSESESTPCIQPTSTNEPRDQLP